MCIWQIDLPNLTKAPLLLLPNLLFATKTPRSFPLYSGAAQLPTYCLPEMALLSAAVLLLLSAPPPLICCDTDTNDNTEEEEEE